MTIDRAVLGHLVGAMAADPARVVTFVEVCGDRLAAVARHHLREVGRADLVDDRDEVQGLVWDIALLVVDHARAWRPDGALPWSWLRAPIRALVAERAGVPLAGPSLEAALAAVVPPPPAPHLDLDRLADLSPPFALLRQALAEVAASDLHRQVHLEYRIQRALGDPSPARTVGELFGLTAANVRQIDRRLRTRLTAVVVGDPRYGALWDIPWIDAGPDHPGDEGDGTRAA